MYTRNPSEILARKGIFFPCSEKDFFLTAGSLSFRHSDPIRVEITSLAKMLLFPHLRKTKILTVSESAKILWSLVAQMVSVGS